MDNLRSIADKVRRFSDLDLIVDRAQRWADAVKSAVENGRRIPSRLLKCRSLTMVILQGLYNGMICSGSALCSEGGDLVSGRVKCR